MIRFWLLLSHVRRDHELDLDHEDIVKPVNWWLTTFSLCVRCIWVKKKMGLVMKIVTCLIVSRFKYSKHNFTHCSQVTVPLSHFINVLHSLKSSVGNTSSSASCKSRQQKDPTSDSEPHCEEVHISGRKSAVPHKGQCDDTRVCFTIPCFKRVTETCCKIKSVAQQL